MNGWLDRRPTWLRDLIVALVAAVAYWAGQDLVPILQGKGGALALLAGILPLVINAVTTATRRYGLGSAPSPERVEAARADRSSRRPG